MGLFEDILDFVMFPEFPLRCFPGVSPKDFSGIWRVTWLTTASPSVS